MDGETIGQALERTKKECREALDNLMNEVNNAVNKARTNNCLKALGMDHTVRMYGPLPTHITDARSW